MRDVLRTFRDIVAGSPRDFACQVGIGLEEESLDPLTDYSKYKAL